MKSSARKIPGTVTEPQTMKNRPHADGCNSDTGASTPAP